MAALIPARETLAEAIVKVMNTHPRVESQRELTDLVLAELRKQDPRYSAGGTRIRKVGIAAGAVKLEIEYREAPAAALPDVCPVCGNAMAPVMNRTLDGGAAEVKRSCTVCPFTVGQTVRAPGRYVFVRAAAHEPSPAELRIRQLRKAASQLRSASRLIGEALAGTSFPQRKEYAQSRIGEILSSQADAGSIPNLIADVRDAEREDPLWTRPLVSPKTVDRKDI